MCGVWQGKAQREEVEELCHRANEKELEVQLHWCMLDDHQEDGEAEKHEAGEVVKLQERMYKEHTSEVMGSTFDDTV